MFGNRTRLLAAENARLRALNRTQAEQIGRLRAQLAALAVNDPRQWMPRHPVNPTRGALAAPTEPYPHVARRS